ncbi:MAG: 1,4-dihydroxy-2-naphthoate polyprenyltransferase [Solirubrobacteraceae bacterium]|nr:1,4-dihydroxy-2-naphthoate polyprenyltransferase [Solirubrobacteraceae bacterium]
MSESAPSLPGPSPGRLARWRHALSTVNPPAGELDQVSRWLVITRAGVLPMTLTAGAIAGLLAARQTGFAAGWYALSFLGIVLAHVSNNLVNDLFDTDTGLDTGDYPRALYAPHPILSGMISRKGLVRAAVFVNVLDVAILVALVLARGWVVLAFGAAGVVLNVAYTAPPLRLKKRGLGELDVLLVWGPLMIAGTYYAAVGHVPWQVWVAGIPYGLLCTSVLMGKHIDKLPWDEAAGIRTLPVILGERRARRATEGLMVGFYVVVVASVAVGALPWPALAAFGAAPLLVRALRALRRPRPENPPRGFPVWPLWFAAFVFTHTRRAGALLVAGMAVAAVFGLGPGWLRG